MGRALMLPRDVENLEKSIQRRNIQVRKFRNSSEGPNEADEARAQATKVLLSAADADSWIAPPFALVTI